MRLLEEDELGARSIDSIRLSDAKEWALRMKKKGYGYQTISNYKRSLNASFRIAIAGDLVRKKPFDFKLNEVLEDDTKPRPVLTEEQEENLLSFVRMDSIYRKCYDVIVILLKTGLRISELCVLTKQDIDLKNGIIRVNHQLLYSKKTSYYIETPKTKSGVRDVPMSEEVKQVFERVMESKQKSKPITIDGYSHFLFLNGKGEPMTDNYWSL